MALLAAPQKESLSRRHPTGSRSQWQMLRRRLSWDMQGPQTHRLLPNPDSNLPPLANLKLELFVKEMSRERGAWGLNLHSSKSLYLQSSKPQSSLQLS